MTPRRYILAAALFSGLAGTALAQDAAPFRIRGTIDAVQAHSMQVTSRTGQKMTVALAPDVGVTAIVATKITDIQPNSYIGTAAMPQPDGTLKALEVQVFPESMRGVGEGNHAWDLQPQSTMTNGTVGSVIGTEGRTLTLSYKGGEKKVVVPENVPIITYVPATPAILTPGAHVIITAMQKPDGSVVATRVGVGKDGLVPPM
jgi:hypothetical protein